LVDDGAGGDFSFKRRHQQETPYTVQTTSVSHTLTKLIKQRPPQAEKGQQARGRERGKRGEEERWEKKRGGERTERDESRIGIRRG
jgi:hypothetical protein